MEPISAATTLGKLLSTGYSLFKVLEGKGGNFEEDLKAYQSLVELGGELGNWLPKDSSAKEGAQALAVLTVAFGKAFQECFGKRRVFDNEKRLQANLTAAVDWAQTSGPADPKAPPLSLSEILADPEKTPYFAALWSTFTQHNLPGKAGRGDIPLFAEALIENPRGSERARFEQVFRRNVGAFLAAPSGRDLSLALLHADQDAERSRWVERLLVGEMANWDQRHVFGNVGGHDTLPPMPLSVMYVEPDAKLRQNARAHTQAVPIRTALREALKTHPLIVVSADFGHGKSLTARTLAYEYAQEFLSNGRVPGADLERPVFLKCQSAFSTSHLDLSAAVRRAQWLVLKDDLAIQSLPESAPALGPPSTKQRTLYLLDGLDEVAFLERDLLHLLDHLRGQLTDRHRAIVFSRPHRLPLERLEEWGIPVYELQPFGTDGHDLGQAGEWLGRWNKCTKGPPIEAEALRTAGLTELARTPILLFMIAYTWGDQDTLYADWKPPLYERAEPADGSKRKIDILAKEESAWDRKHLIYESFFRSIAWGKYERDCETHPLIFKAARALRETLESRGLVGVAPALESDGRNEPQPTERARLTQAMLWLMGRIAWHAQCLQQQPKPKTLTSFEIDHLLLHELDLDDRKIAEVVRDGLLLTMQADLSENNRPILFGHQSFREFLVARCWADLLRVIVEPDSSVSEKTEMLKILRSGRLRGDSDRSFDFLRARLRQWSQTQQLRLYQWAMDEFNNDGIETQPPTLRDRARRDFRTTALAVASAVRQGEDLCGFNEDALRSLLASYWTSGDPVSLWAPRLRANEVVLAGANLAGANLAGANLRGAKLERADLTRADLRGADLDTASLTGAIFSGANLNDASLVGADLTRANLFGADLMRADLANAVLTQANLERADMEEASLEGADLKHAILERAILVDADFSKADLEGANISGASLVDANLQKCCLRWAKLTGVHLEGARLDHADLEGANLSGASLDDDGWEHARSRVAIVDESTLVHGVRIGAAAAQASEAARAEDSE